VIAVVGGPAARESAIPGSTVKLDVLLTDPDGPVTVIGPVEVTGTDALIDVAEATPKDDATP
jgi:hypothetical protein